MLHTRKQSRKLPLEFDDIYRCRTDSRENKRAVCSLEGTLIGSTNPFPYLMLLAIERGALARALLLLAAFPLSLLLRFLISDEAAMQVLVFITFCGVKASTVEFLSKSVLAKAYFRDMNSLTLSVFVSFGKKYVVSVTPRIMIEPFLKEYIGVDSVIGSELQVLSNGYCTGLVRSGGLILSGRSKLEALKVFTEGIHVDVGFGSGKSDYQFMSQCKEAYKAVKKKEAFDLPSSAQDRIKPLIFHDGRLAVLPTPAMSLAILLWIPLAIVLALLRILVPHSPHGLMLPLAALLGIKIRIKGPLPVAAAAADQTTEKLLFVTSHRTLLDPLFLSALLRRDVTAVTYSISRLTELLSSIKTVRLSRDRDSDNATIRHLLANEDVVICPEGTTCREPYLLRFSPLFAEVSDRILPVMMFAEMRMFYATSVRGWKWMDPFFFCMNVQPSYAVEFLEALEDEKTCGKGQRSSVEVANYVQGELARVSGFKATFLTRRDKYSFLTEA